MKGFTLVETMVAVSIIALAVTAPLYTADRAIVAAQNASNQLTALYLAQEGIEYVRAMRDSMYLQAYKDDLGARVSTTDGWNYFINNAYTAKSGNIYQCIAGACSLDAARTAGTGGGLALAPCAGGPTTCAVLYLGNNGRYNQTSSGQATIFRRGIQAFAIPSSSTEERIVSTVTWSFHNTTYTVSATDNLSSWQ